MIIKVEVLQSLFEIITIDAFALAELRGQRFLLAQHEPSHRETMGAADHKLATIEKHSNGNRRCKKKGSKKL